MAPYTRSMHRRSQIRNWPQLEEGILDLILQRLPYPGTLNFGKVFSGWRSVFRGRRALSRPPQCILLGSTSRGGTLHRGIIHGGRLLRLLSPIPNLHSFNRIVGSGFGWLVIASQIASDIYLLNPASDERISLPSLALFSIRHVDLFSSPGNGDYVLVATTQNEQGQVHSLAWWTPGDQQWTIKNFEQLLKQCVDSVFHKGKFYILCNNGQFYTFDPQTKDHAHVRNYNFSSINHIPFKRLVSSNGELLMVLRQNVGSRFYVLRNVEERGGPWEWVDSLGDRVLMIGIHGAESICTKELMGSTYKSSSVYCLADRRTENIVIDQPFLEWIVTKEW